MKFKQILPQYLNENCGAYKLMEIYKVDSIYSVIFYDTLRKPQEEFLKTGIKPLIENWLYNEQT